MIVRVCASRDLKREVISRRCGRKVGTKPVLRGRRFTPGGWKEENIR